MKGTNMCVMVKNPICPEVKLWVGAIERIHRSGIVKLAAVHRGFSTSYKSNYRYPPLWRLVEEMKKYLPDIPVICDPSHICGNLTLIEHVIHKAIKLRYEGFMIEVHNNPELAMSDSGQQITPAMFHKILRDLIKDKRDDKYIKDSYTSIRGKE
jgi:chorismate mutase